MGHTGFGVGSVAFELSWVGLDIVRSPLFLRIRVAPVWCTPGVWTCRSLLDWGLPRRLASPIRASLLFGFWGMFWVLLFGGLGKVCLGMLWPLLAFLTSGEGIVVPCSGTSARVDEFL